MDTLHLGRRGRSPECIQARRPGGLPGSESFRRARAHCASRSGSSVRQPNFSALHRTDFKRLAVAGTAPPCTSVMITCLGWALLVWSPDTLPNVGEWQSNGPQVRLEFLRQS